MSRTTRIIINVVLILAVIAAVMYGVYYFLEHYRIDPEKIFVEGNDHYSAQEIRDIVMDGFLGDNSFVLSLKYKDKKITDIAFVDSITVSVPSADSIRITVYEKALAGYVKFLDHYIYFDKDGYAVESSTILTDGIPQVSGITFDSVEVGKPLGSEDNSVFQQTLVLTKLMDKYDLSVDRIFFHEDGKVTLFFGKVRVNLGDETDYLEDKIMELPQFLQVLEGKAGVLGMEEYDEDMGMYIFKYDEEEK